MNTEVRRFTWCSTTSSRTGRVAPTNLGVWMRVLRGTRTFVVRGEVFRDAVARALGAKSLRSTLFTVKKSKDAFVFSGKGYGHGVGLCQAGMIARVRAGASVEDVLARYFPGTRLTHRIP